MIDRNNNWWPTLASLAIAILSTAWILAATPLLSATFDEPVYMKCGLDCWANHTHKPLMRLGTMPLPVDAATLPQHLWFWWHGTVPDWERDFGWILQVARVTAILFWWNLLFQAFRLGRQIGTPWTGFWALALVAIEPNLMGHAALATTDVAVTGCILATLVEYLRYRIQPGRLQWWKVVVWWAISLFAKASSLVFVPILILSADIPDLIATWRSRQNLSAFTADFWRRLKGWMAMGFTALGLLFLLVGSDFQRERTFVEWAVSLPEGALRTAMVWTSDNLRIFTNAGEGLAQQIKHNMKGHSSYILGVGTSRAVWYHFPLLLLIKMPTWFWLLLPFTLWRQWKYPWPAGLCACALLLAFSLNCRVQIGIRLVFPLVMMLTLLTGVSLAAWWREARDRPVAPAIVSFLLLAWAGVTMARGFPDGIRYLNDFWSWRPGPQTLVSDSNYDWGQGLWDLAKKTKPDPENPLWVVYWGGDPRVDKPPFRKLIPAAHGLMSPEAVEQWLPGKSVAVSATILHGPPLHNEYEHLRAYFQNRQPDLLTNTYAVYHIPEKPR